ncbi:hypothetical protein FTV95_23840 [Escherichia coli]|nr:hypothetical protein FTV95_23840 [Escherichia coli]
MMPGIHPAKKHKIPYPVEPFIGGVINLKFPYLVWLNLFQLHLVSLYQQRDNPTRIIAPYLHFKRKYESCALLFTLVTIAFSATPPNGRWKTGALILK